MALSYYDVKNLHIKNSMTERKNNFETGLLFFNRYILNVEIPTNILCAKPKRYVEVLCPLRRLLSARLLPVIGYKCSENTIMDCIGILFSCFSCFSKIFVKKFELSSITFEFVRAWISSLILVHRWRHQFAYPECPRNNGTPRTISKI